MPCARWSARPWPRRPSPTSARSARAPPTSRGWRTLPTGLIAANIDLGPHIVAMTPHRVVAAPYHRLDKGILANHAILHGTPEEAERTARSLGVSYIALCGATNAAGAMPARPDKYPDSLRARLMREEPIGFLQEIAPAAGQADPRLARAAGGLADSLGWRCRRQLPGHLSVLFDAISVLSGRQLHRRPRDGHAGFDARAQGPGPLRASRSSAGGTTDNTPRNCAQRIFRIEA